MRRPWQIWLLFGLGLSVVVPGMCLLTWKALELDRAELLARRQAELEEDVSRALWRMDSLLTPLLAEEAARPEFVYRPIYAIAGSESPESAPTSKGQEGKPVQPAPRQELSPLLRQTPQFVLVHFEIHSNGSVTSPQNPIGPANTWALDNGASLDSINTAAARLAELRPSLVRDELLAMLPEQPLPSAAWNDLREPVNSVQTAANPPLISSNFDQLGQQLDQRVQQPVANSQAGGQGFVLATPQPPPSQQEQEDEPMYQQQAVGQQAANTAYGPVEIGRSQRAQSRAGNDLPNRSAYLQSETQRSYSEQRSNLKSPSPGNRVVEGISRPLWLGERLVLARRVQVGGQTSIQGCWLDWPALRERLRSEVADLLPEVQLVPLSAAEPVKLSRVLATLPVQLSAPLPVVTPDTWSPIRVSLAVAWLGLFVGAVATAATLQGIITLSERRGAFVSAVTHELRTPLTTFRMYAEMLADGMVPDANQRQRYLNTLRIEADRLSHLVENVLQYARLERGRPGKRREPTTIGALLAHCQSRLADRAAQAEMKLIVESSEEESGTSIATDSAAVEQILFNLVDNACKYAAAASDKRLHLNIAVEPRRVQIVVRDHGPGISGAGRKRLFRPFSKSVHEAANSAPGVGLGLALSRRLAADLGGKLELQSPADGGAAFVLTLPK